MSQPTRILIEGAGTATAISVLKGLSKQTAHEYETVVVDVEDMVAGRYFADHFVITPMSSSEEYIDYMIALCKEKGVSIYIPIIDYGFEKLAAAKQRFADEGIYLMIADSDSIAITADKLKTFEFFKSQNILTAETRGAASEEEIDSLSYPLLIKPRTGGRASLGVHKIQDATEFRRLTAEDDNYVIQPIIDGMEFTAGCLASLDGSEFISAVIRDRIETKSGVSVKSRFVDEALEERILPGLKTIVETLRIPGFCNIQGFYNDKGELFFSEVNPRFAGAHAFDIQAGLNAIEHIVSMHKGDTASDIRSRITLNKATHMVRYWNEVYYDDNESWTWGPLMK